MPVKPSRREFGRGVAALTATVLVIRSVVPASAETAADEGVVLARATAVVLDAAETHVVLAPVPPPRRRPPKAKLPKGAKPAPPRTHLVLRDVVIGKGTPAYEVSLVLEGPNVFEATTTRIQVGTLQRGEADTDGGKPHTVTFDASDAFARFAKVRGFNLRHLRVVIARRAVKNEEGKEKVPTDPAPPEIGAIELTRL